MTNQSEEQQIYDDETRMIALNHLAQRLRKRRDELAENESVTTELLTSFNKRIENAEKLSSQMAKEYGSQEGMELRDYIACKAMVKLIYDTGWDDEDIAEASYSLADAMMKVRAKVK